jgi:hypothetical protein
MRHFFATSALIASLGFGLAGQQAAQPADPIAGNWRGTIKPATGAESPFIITLVKRGDVYSGIATGLGGIGEVPLKTVTVAGNRVTFEAAADSKLGPVAVKGDLLVEANRATGAGALSVGPQAFDVAFALQRRGRQEVVQPQVEQSVAYFLGKWTFEYLGGEFPPLSVGSRDGTATFAKGAGANFITGQVDSQVNGKTYRENISIGFDPDARALAFLERRPDGVELLSVASWHSPLAIVFQTSPVRAGNRTYQLRRVIAVTSETAFEITEEFSVDGGPFRRLGTGQYTRAQ